MKTSTPSTWVAFCLFIAKLEWIPPCTAQVAWTTTHSTRRKRWGFLQIPTNRRCVVSTVDKTFGASPLHADNNQQQNDHAWEKVSNIASIESPWLKIFGERLKDDQGRLLDYWRVEKADSVVIVTLHRDRLIFPRPMYRPGLGTSTLDFPGGRVPPVYRTSPMQAVPDILNRELGILEDDIEMLDSLNSVGWPVNSSFSNQKLFGAVAKIKRNVELDPMYLHSRNFANTPDDMNLLLETDLTCLQCRAVLLEWLRRESTAKL